MTVDNTRIQRADLIGCVRVGENLYLLPTSNPSSPVVLSGLSAVRLWDATADNPTRLDVYRALASAFQTDPDKVQEDIDSALEVLRQLGVLRWKVLE